MGMTQHTLKYMHKRRGFCKAEKNSTSVRQLRVANTRTRTTKAKDYRRCCK